MFALIAVGLRAAGIATAHPDHAMHFIVTEPDECNVFDSSLAKKRTVAISFSS